MTVAGCGGPTWHFAYDEGLRQARREERDLLVFYKDPLDVRSGRMRDVLEDGGVLPLVNGRVRCQLVPSYAPDRAFVSQYGIDDAPALILIHPDGTFHALAGEHDAAAVRAFLESSQAPGAHPNRNPRLPQGASLEYFNSFDRAVEKAQNQNRRLVIVYKWWLQGESTELIRRFSRPDVARYFADSVNCILDWDYALNRAFVARYGVSHFPAMVIVDPNGQYRTLTGVPSVDQIIRFARADERSDADGGSPPVVWFADHSAARLVAERTGRRLVLFFASDGSDSSDTMGRILDSPRGRAVLAHSVNCRLDSQKAEDRAYAGRYGVSAAPACIAVAPDGSVAVRTVFSSIGDLETFLRPTAGGEAP